MTTISARAHPDPRKQLLPLLALLMGLLLGITQGAEAATATAANTLITNTVSVNFDDALGNNNTTVQASATVTVTLLAAAPTLSSPADTSVTTGGTVGLTYLITSNANGEDTYNFSSVSVDNNVTAPGLTTPSAVLGGTSLAADTVVGLTITVPYDEDADGDATSTNGITAGDTIVISGVAYVVEVGGISENSGTKLTTITLTTNVAGAISAGEQIGERKSIDVDVTAGTIGGASPTHTVDTTATSVADGTKNTTQGTSTVVTVTMGALTVSKEVSSDGGLTFGVVNAAPGATLTYRITVTNTGTGDATNVEITDPMPTYTTYKTPNLPKGKVTTNAESNLLYTEGTLTALTDADAGDDGYDYNVTTAGTATYTIGTMAQNARVFFFYQVTID